ncbi:hypothetical protein Tco_1194477 [Tanacetum coccineum]
MFPEAVFEDRFRMSRSLFTSIVEELTLQCEFFHEKEDCTGKLEISPLIKCTSAIRQLAYGIVPDALDEYLQMGNATSRQCLENFCTSIVHIFGPEFLRKPTLTDVERLYAFHENKHGFPGILGSLDFTQDELKSLDNDIDDVQGQGYDNGSNMKVFLRSGLASLRDLEMPITLRPLDLADIYGRIFKKILMMKLMRDISSQGEPKILKDYKAEYKKMKAKLELLEAIPSTSQSSKPFQSKNKGLERIMLAMVNGSTSPEEEQLKEEKKINEKWLNSSNKVERHNLNNKLPNFNTGRTLVPESQDVNECLKLTKAPTDPESSKESESEPLTALPLLKNLHEASPSSEVMPLTYQDHSPKKTPGLEQPGPKVVLSDNSSCITEGYGSINYGGIFDDKQGKIFNANKEIVLIAPRRNDVYALDMSSLTSNGACFFAKASEILGIPSLVYSKDKPGSTCEKEKHKRASFKTKQNFSIKKCLYLLHMDLFGLVSPIFINHKKYTLVIVDEYLRYPVFIHNHKDHLGKFNAKADDGYFLGYSFVFKAFKEDDPSIQYQANFDISYYIIPHGRSLIELTQDTHVPEVITSNEQNTPHTEDVKGPPDLISIKGTQEQNVQNEQINSEPTEESSRNYTETSVPTTEPSVSEVTQPQITHHASTSSHPAPQDKWSRDQHTELVKIISEPTEGMLTRSMAAKLISSLAITQDELKSLDLDIDDVRGQGYDNGSNMKDVATKEVEGLISFFAKFRDTGFHKAINLDKQIAIEMDIDRAFHQWYVIRRKRQFDEILVDQDTSYSIEESFTLNSFDDNTLKSHCNHLEAALKNSERPDVDAKDLYMKFRKMFFKTEIVEVILEVHNVTRET